MKEHFTCLVKGYMIGKPEMLLSTSLFRNKEKAIEYAERMMGIVQIVSNINGVVWERKELDAE